MIWLRNCAFLILVLVGLSAAKTPGQDGGPKYGVLTGSIFFPEPTNPFGPPQVRELKLPNISDAESIWGSTGRDSRGHIWVGVSMGRFGTGAHLLEFDPKADTWLDHGVACSEWRVTHQREVIPDDKAFGRDDGWMG